VSQAFFDWNPGSFRVTPMPKGRSETYAVWKACERLRLTPPNVKQAWSDNDTETQGMIIAYSQIRESEDADLASIGVLRST
jgi:hypothetical protein